MTTKLSYDKPEEELITKISNLSKPLLKEVLPKPPAEFWSIPAVQEFEHELRSNILNRAQNDLSTWANKAKILIIHTGGTIGSVLNAQHVRDQPTGDEFTRYVRQLLGEEGLTPLCVFSELKGKVDIYENKQLRFDSAKLDPQYWITLTELIKMELPKYRGIVITHGTDTLAYTAAALTFMCRHLCRPIIITASQIPLIDVKNDTDALGNLLGACKLAYHSEEDGIPVIPEVCVYFNRKIMSSSRIIKVDANGLDAFQTPRVRLFGTYTSREKFDIDTLLVNHLCYKRLTKAARRNKVQVLQNCGVDMLPRFTRFSGNDYAKVMLLQLYPGFDKNLITFAAQLVGEGGGLVIRSFGTGNAPDSISEAISEVVKKIAVVNCTECQRGDVVASYAACAALKETTSVLDMTPEATFAKLWVLLNYNWKDDVYPNASSANLAEVAEAMQMSLRGELAGHDSFSQYLSKRF